MDVKSLGVVLSLVFREQSMEHATFIQCLFNVILYLIILGIVIPFFRHKSLVPNLVVKKKYTVLIILALILCVYPFWAGDYLNMMTDYKLARQGEQSNWEQVYMILSRIIASYSLLRLVIWGGSLYLLHRFFNLLTIEDKFVGVYTVLFFFAMCLPNYSYLRAASCMSLIFLGVGIFFKNENKLKWDKFVALLFILASFFFHKSALIAIFVAIISYFSVHLKHIKFFLILLLFLIPYAVQYGNELINNFLLISPVEDSSINIYAAQNYFNEQMEFGKTGSGIMVQNVLTRTQYYLVAFVYLLMLIKGYYKNMPNYVKFFANFSFFIIVIANITLFAFDFNSTVLYYRIMYYSMIPSAAFLAYCFSRNYFKGICTLTFYIAIIGTLYTFIYSTYNVL